MGELLFGSPAMLGWLLAAAVPWVIYFFHRPRRTELQWGAMEFLRRAIKHERTHRRSEWLLLTLRTLAIAVIAAAFADPRWKQRRDDDVAAPAKLRIAVLDLSFSMNARSEGTTPLAAAQRQIGDWAEQADREDRLQIVVLSDRPQLVFAEPTQSPAVLRREVDALRATQGQANLSATLALVAQALEKDRADFPAAAIPEVVWWSDMQRSTWGTHDATWQEAWTRLQKQAAVQLRDVGRPAVNLAVTEVRCEEALLTPGRSASIVARIDAFGGEAAQSTTVRLWIDGEQAAEERVEIPARGSVDMRWDHVFPLDGDHSIAVEVVDPVLETDNRRWTIASVRSQIRLLAVEGSAGESRPFRLAADPDPGPSSHIVVDTSGESAWGERDLLSYDLIYLANIAAMPPPFLARLREYLADGGGVVIALGDRSERELWDALSQADDDKQPLSPATIEPPQETALVTFDPLQYEHPLIRVFRGFERSGLLTTPVWKHFELRPRKESATALGFSDGTPAVVTHDFGRGRVVLWAIPLSSQAQAVLPDGAKTPWTAIDAWPSFPPLVQELLKYAARGRRLRPAVLVGRPLEGYLDATADANDVRMRLPAGDSERLATESLAGRLRWKFENTAQAGVYELSPDGGRGAAKYAVNVDSIESDLSRISTESWPTQSPPGEASPLRAGSPRSGGETRWFRPLLAAAALLLLMEAALAWRLGRSVA